MEVVWTDLAQATLRETLSFVIERWSETVALKVRTAVYRDVRLLEQFPRLGKRCFWEEVAAYEVRCVVVDKLIKVFYLIHEEKIYVVMVWDVRRNPVVLEDMLLDYFRKME